MYNGGLYAQELNYRNFSVRNGLPSSETYAVLQDSKGYIWIAGDAGVSKYNGHQFENYTTSDGLADNTIFNLYEDKKGRIWFLSYSGNLSYYEKGEIKKIFPNGELSLFIQNQFLKHIVIDSLDNIWLGTNHNLFKLNLKSKIFDCKIMYTPQGYYIKEIENSFICGRRLGADFDTTQIKFNIDWKGKVISKELPNTNFTRSNMGFAIDSKKQGVFYNFNKRIFFNLESGELDQGTLPYEPISVYTDKKDRCWFGTFLNGVYLYEGNHVNSKFVKQFLKGKSVTMVFQDNEGGYWFSTLEQGVYYISESQISNISENDKPLKNVKIASFKDSLIFGVATEVGGFGAKQNYFEEINFLPNKVGNTATSIFVDSKTNVWFGISLNSFIYNPESKKIIKNPFGSFSWTGVTEDNHGDIWMSSHGCLYKICSSELKICDTIRLVKRPLVLKTGINNEIFIGSLDGLWKYEKDSLIYLGNKHPFFKNRIDDILILKDGSVCLATKGAGLGIWKNGDIKNIKISTGLQSSICKSLAIDNDGNVWVGTNRGLSRIVIEKGKYTVNSFTKRHGLIDNEINSIAFCNDKLWVATNEGLSYHNPQELFKKKIVAPIFIKKIFTVDSTYIPGEIPLELSYKENFIEIEFEALTYIDPNNTKYLYRLLGLNSKWRTTNNSSLQFSHLPPGKYLFEVAVLSIGTNALNSSAKFPFYVMPPFWDLWWFKVLIALIIAGLTFYVFRYQNKRYRYKIKRKYEYEKKLAEIELRALRAQLNPHFIFNCLGTVQNLILKNKNDAAEAYITRFSKLLRTVLASSSENVISLEQELETARFYIELETLRFAQGFKYTIEIQTGINVAEIDIPPMLIQPFIENAIWHGLSHKEGDKNLEIIVSKNPDSNVCLTIADNGIGREKSQQLNQDLKKFKSYGINLIHDRIISSNIYSERKINLSIIDLKDEQNRPLGTLVKLLIPE